MVLREIANLVSARISKFDSWCGRKKMEAILIILILIGILLFYRFLLFLLPMIFPNFIVSKDIEISRKIKNYVKDLTKPGKEETLRRIFRHVDDLYSSEMHKEFTLPHTHFHRDVNKLIDKVMFLPCHVQNLVLKTLLIASGHFSAKDFVKKIEMTIYGTVHQYLIIDTGKKKFKADPFYNKLEEIKKK